MTTEAIDKLKERFTKMVDALKSVRDDMSSRLQALKTEDKRLQNEINTLRKDFDKLKDQNKFLKDQNDKLLKLYEGMLSELNTFRNDRINNNERFRQMDHAISRVNTKIHIK